LPPHSIDLLIALSRQIAVKVPHLSLDIIGAFLEYFVPYSPQQKEYGLLYIQPWIPQIETQLRSGSADYAETTKEIKSILRAFVRLTYDQDQVRSFLNFLMYSWGGILIYGRLLASRLNWPVCCSLNCSIMRLTRGLIHGRPILLQEFCLLVQQLIYKVKSSHVCERFPIILDYSNC